MFDIKELFEQTNRLKRAGGLIGNNYLSLSALTEFSKQEDSILAYNKNVVALICEDVGVTRLHFYLSSLEAAPALKELLEPIPQRPIIVDCVGKQNQVDAVSKALCKAGFAPYTSLSRLRTSKVPYAVVPEGLVQAACPEEASEILNLLVQTFDPYVSHLPSKEKLLRLINDRLIYRIVKDSKVVAVECLEKVGTHGLYLYQGAADPAYRGQGLGSYVLQYCLNSFRDSCTFFTVWVEEGNSGSLGKMHRIGMAFDGLQDEVLIYK